MHACIHEPVCIDSCVLSSVVQDGPVSCPPTEPSFADGDRWKKLPPLNGKARVTDRRRRTTLITTTARPRRCELSPRGGRRPDKEEEGTRPPRQKVSPPPSSEQHVCQEQARAPARKIVSWEGEIHLLIVLQTPQPDNPGRGSKIIARQVTQPDTLRFFLPSLRRTRQSRVLGEQDR